MSTTELWLKCLTSTGTGPYTGKAWPLPADGPADGQPGEWMPPQRPAMCMSGYHVLADTRQLLAYGLGYDVWLVEVRGEAVHSSGKSAWEQARLVERLPWDDRARRLFAADCAEDVLELFETKYPDDTRPRQAIAAARLFADGMIGRRELAAARAAAGAAGDAAWAARAAGDAAGAARAAGAAAWAAAAAAGAAGDAAGDAAGAAGDAAWAAGDAAWAARAAQAIRLADYLGIEPPATP